MESDNKSISVVQLIFVPFLISLLVTLFRLAGEISHWSETWFYRPSGGIVPTKTNWVVGITWLAIPFGAYFAYRISKSEVVETNAYKAIGLAVLGLIFFYKGVDLVFRLPIGFPKILLLVWSVAVLAAGIQLFGWRTLTKTLLVYGLASRAVVALIMLLAMRGNWGTHYDYIDMPPELKVNFWSEYFWLAFFPQLIFWVGFTIVAGSLSGAITLAIMSLRKSKKQHGNKQYDERNTAGFWRNS